MNPARATLRDLVGDGLLERVPVDENVVANLVRQAGNHLRSARRDASDDPEGAFQLAYDACRKICLALVLAAGLRPKGDGHHATTFDAASELAAHFGARQQVRDAAQLRYVRNGAEYRAEAVSSADVEDAIEIGSDLLSDVAPNIDKIVQSAT